MLLKLYCLKEMVFTLGLENKFNICTVSFMMVPGVQYMECLYKTSVHILTKIIIDLREF